MRCQVVLWCLVLFGPVSVAVMWCYTLRWYPLHDITNIICPPLLVKKNWRHSFQKAKVRKGLYCFSNNDCFSIFLENTMIKNLIPKMKIFQGRGWVYLYIMYLIWICKQIAEFLTLSRYYTLLIGPYVGYQILVMK